MNKLIAIIAMPIALIAAADEIDDIFDEAERTVEARPIPVVSAAERKGDNLAAEKHRAEAVQFYEVVLARKANETLNKKIAKLGALETLGKRDEATKLICEDWNFIFAEYNAQKKLETAAKKLQRAKTSAETNALIGQIKTASKELETVRNKRRKLWTR